MTTGVSNDGWGVLFRAMGRGARVFGGMESCFWERGVIGFEVVGEKMLFLLCLFVLLEFEYT